jgi:capsule polysaccharide export protein KpsE/RkpR
MKQALIETEPDEAGSVEIAVPRPFRPDLLLGKIRLLWRERPFIYKVTGLGATLALAVALLIPKEFESTLCLMPPDSQSGASMAMMAALSSKAGGGLGSVAGDLLGLKSSGELFIGILQSRTVQYRLIDRFDLRKVYGKRLWQDARKKLAANTAISEDRKSGIITVTVTDRDPRRAAAMGQAYLDELNRLVAELSTSGAHCERVFLEERLKTVQQELEVAEKDFSEFASKNMAIDIKEQGRAMVEAAAVLQGQLIAAESEMEGLRQIYSDNNVRVRSVQARITELKQQIDKVGGKGEGTAAGTASQDSLYPSIKKLPVLGVTYADLFRRTKVQEAIYEALTQQYELAKVQEVRETPSVKVLDPANIPEKKSFPPRTLIVALAMIFSILFAVGWILGRAHWQMMDPGHPAKMVALGIYGDARSHLKHAAQNGSRLGWLVRRLQQANRREMVGRQ